MTLEPIAISEPHGRDEVATELRALAARSHTVWSSFSTPAFFAPLGDAWSPADNVRHLLKSNRPVLRALTTPRSLLLLRFGIGTRRSRTYGELRDVYLAKLASGLTAGPFTPSPLPASEHTDPRREALLNELDAVVQHLADALARWSEGALDRFRLPHPALGRLSVREMMFFTLYHNLHHVRNVIRLAGISPTS